MTTLSAATATMARPGGGKQLQWKCTVTHIHAYSAGKEITEMQYTSAVQCFHVFKEYLQKYILK